MRIILGLLLLTIIGITLWNYIGAVRLSDINDDYIGIFYEGTYREKNLTVAGVELITVAELEQALEPYVIDE